MKWPVYVISIVYINKACVIAKSAAIVKKIQSTNASYPSIPVSYINSTNARYPAIVIVKDRNVFHLDNSTIIIVLHKCVIVETGVKSDTDVPDTGTDTYINTVINVKIEFPVRINRKRYAIFNKNELVSVIVIDGNNLILQRCGLVGNCSKKYRCNKKY